MKTPLFVEKQTLRHFLTQQRRALSEERRSQAARDVFDCIIPLLKPFHTVLSFHSFASEIHTHSLNAYLAAEKKLLLPKISKPFLTVHVVNDLTTQLSTATLQEPDPIQCPEIALDKIDCLLVPGLGFDIHNHRIGYGQGHYDHLLAQLKKLPNPPLTIGLGFKEQAVKAPLPRNEHDLALDQILLF